MHACCEIEPALQIHPPHQHGDGDLLAALQALDAAALALMPDDSHTRLKGQPGEVKRVAWCPPVPLDAVKNVGRALNCSINDVLMSCVAGAIGNYLRAQGDDPSGQEIRAMIPINLRPLEEAWKLGNRFGLVPLVLAHDQPGGELLAPLAIVQFGGLISATILNLLVLPAAWRLGTGIKLPQ